jgi:hypothetical protein
MDAGGHGCVAPDAERVNTRTCKSENSGGIRERFGTVRTHRVITPAAEIIES